MIYNKQIQVELQEVMGSDRSIAESAWTSSSTYQQKKTRTDEEVKRVVNMLADSKHSVPFESVVFRFWIRLPIQTDRQHMTHRITSSSGLSARYRTMPNDFLEIPADICDILQRHDNITGNPGLSGYYKTKYKEICEQSNEFYRDSLKEFKSWEKSGYITNSEYKRLREFYRGVLPQNNMTERVTVINLRSFANYYKLRSKSDAQIEIQQIAEMMLQEIIKSNKCPIAINALIKNNWNI